MQNEHLQAMRTEILQQIVGLGDYLADNDSVGYDVLLSLARSTSETRFLDLALRKIKAIEDKGQRSEALFALLDEVELTLAETPAEPAPQPEPDQDPDHQQ